MPRFNPGDRLDQVRRRRAVVPAPAAPASLARTVKDVAHVFVDGAATWSTGAFASTSGGLLVAMLEVMVNGTSSNDPSERLTITDNQGLTWTRRAIAGDSNAWSIGAVIWTAPVAAGASTTITFGTSPSETIFYACSVVLQYTGQAASPVGAVATGTTGGSLPRTMSYTGASSITLDATPAATSEIVGIAALDPIGATSATAGAGYVELDDFDAGGSAVHAQVRPVGSTSTAFEWIEIATGNTYKNAAVAIEIKAA